MKVEWLFAFEIQCNAFVPVFFLLYLVQFLLLPLLLQVRCPKQRNLHCFPRINVSEMKPKNFGLPIKLSCLQPGLLALLLSNTLYAAAASWYQAIPCALPLDSHAPTLQQVLLPSVSRLQRARGRARFKVVPLQLAQVASFAMNPVVLFHQNASHRSLPPLCLSLHLFFLF
jgi:hypothetical protein